MEPFLAELPEVSERRISRDWEAAMLENESNGNRILGAIPKYQQLGKEDRQDVYIARYDAEIVAMDRAFGQVLQFLREKGIWDESVVTEWPPAGWSLPRVLITEWDSGG